MKEHWGSKRRLRRALCLVLAAAFLCLGTVPALADDGSISDLNSKYNQLEQQTQALQAKINEAKTEKARQEAIKAKTTQEMNIVRQQIAVLEEKITLLEQEIAQKEAEIEGLEDEIDRCYDLYKVRMRAMYMAGDTSPLGLVLGTQGFGEFLTRSEVMRAVADHDQTLLENLRDALAAVEEAKAAVEADRAELDDTKRQADQKRGQLNNTLTATNAAIQDIASMEKEYLANKAKLEKEMKAVQAEIDAIYASMASMGDYVGGGFMYPVPGYRGISSYFGWRFNNSDFHTGVDFTGAGVNGKTVVASNSGVVAFTKTTFVPGQGYGKYLIIDHGGGYSTLYAHLSAIHVSVGDYVSKGKAIAAVGSTGWSTGPHLHFEVRVDGVAQNPLNYLAG